MKKQLLLCLLMITCTLATSAQVCTLDTFTIPGIYPDTIVNLPKGYTTSAYGTVIQVRVFTDTMSPAGNVHVDDIQINSVTGLPAGFTYACNPTNCTFPGGGNGCIYLSGTPSAGQAGVFPLIVNVTLHGKLFNIFPVTQSSQILGYKIQILGPPVTNFSASATTICKGESVTYTDLSTNEPTTWAWTFPGGTPSSSNIKNPVVTYNTTGNHNATLTAGSPAGNNTHSKTAYMHVKAIPTASFTSSGPLTLCQGSSLLFTANSGSGLLYQWLKNGVNISGATAQTLLVSAAGTYKVRVTNSNGCSKTSSTKQVTISTVQATASAGGSTTFCSGENVLLTANAGVGLGYQWKKDGVGISGATTQNYSATTTGTYKVTVTNSNGCSKVSTGIIVTSKPLPAAAITANGPLTFCAGGNVLFTASAGNNYTYKWKKNGSNITNAVQQTYTATSSGNYKVVVTGQNGCTKASPAKTVLVNCKEEINDVPLHIMEAELYPNPACDQIILKYMLAHEGTVKMAIYDVQGRLVLNGIEKYQLQGSYEEKLFTNGLPAGLYIVKINTADHIQTIKLMIDRS